jgi:hypothetical protein
MFPDHERQIFFVQALESRQAFPQRRKGCFAVGSIKKTIGIRVLRHPCIRGGDDQYATLLQETV